MAHTYKNSKVDLSSTNDTVLYTVPATTTSVVKSILVSNDDTSNACHITVTLLNTGNTVFSLFKQVFVHENLDSFSFYDHIRMYTELILA